MEKLILCRKIPFKDGLMIGKCNLVKSPYFTELVRLKLLNVAKQDLSKNFQKHTCKQDILCWLHV